jgi:hypothetical protein
MDSASTALFGFGLLGAVLRIIVSLTCPDCYRRRHKCTDMDGQGNTWREATTVFNQGQLRQLRVG